MDTKITITTSQGDRSVSRNYLVIDSNREADFNIEIDDMIESVKPEPEDKKVIYPE